MNKKNRVICSCVCSVLIFILIKWIKPNNLDNRLNDCWNVITISAVICIFIFVMVICHERDIFSPYVISSVLLSAIFIYAPLMCIVNNDLLAVGNVDVFDGCVKATWIYVLAYITFSFGYTTKKRFVIKRSKNKRNYTKKISDDGSESDKVKRSFIIWSVCIIIALIYDLSRGVSIIYIFSYGLLGSGVSGSSLNNSLAILGNFAYCLIICWLYILNYSKNKFFILIIGLLTGSIYFSRGFRFVMIIMILAPIVYKYLKIGKRPKVINMIFLIVLLLVFAGLIEVSRGAIRSGVGGINMSYSPIQLINRVFESDFTIFKQFYAMVVHVPRDLNYKFGQEMFFYTLIMAIPRGLWINKPDFPYKEVLQVSLNEQAVTAGQAWPILGAFYFEFGILGCMFFMFVLGYLFSRIFDRVRYNELTPTYIIGYSVFLPSIMQILCRGCIPQQAYMLAFSFLPIFLIRKIKIKI